MEVASLTQVLTFLAHAFVVLRPVVELWRGGEVDGRLRLLLPVECARRGREECGTIVSICRWVFGAHGEARVCEQDAITTCFGPH